MFGQVVVGFEGDWVGRRFGLVQDALVMFLGLIMLTASWGTSLNGWVICTFPFPSQLCTLTSEQVIVFRNSYTVSVSAENTL
jgi:hypothetical protein